MHTVLRIDDEFQEIGTKTIDDRNRLTLGDLFRGYKRVRLYKNERGELLLQPTVEIPASELWLFQNREALKAVQTGLKDASEGKIVKVDLDRLQEHQLFEIFLTHQAQACLHALKVDKERGRNSFHKKAHRFGPDLFDLKSQKLK